MVVFDLLFSRKVAYVVLIMFCFLGLGVLTELLDGFFCRDLAQGVFMGIVDGCL